MCWQTVIPFGKYKGYTFNEVRICNMKYLGWAYKNVPYFTTQIDSDAEFYSMIREHELLPHWHKEHVSRHYCRTTRSSDIDHDASLFAEH